MNPVSLNRQSLLFALRSIGALFKLNGFHLCNLGLQPGTDQATLTAYHQDIDVAVWLEQSLFCSHEEAAARIIGLDHATLLWLCRTAYGATKIILEDGTLVATDISGPACTQPQPIPPSPTIEESDAWALPRGFFEGVHDTVVWAVGSPSTRNSELGIDKVLVTQSDGWLSAIASDGARMSVYPSVPPPSDRETTILLPRSLPATLAALTRPPKGWDGTDWTVRIMAHGTLAIQSNSVTLVVRCADHSYPPWRGAVPDKAKATTTVKLGRAGTLAALLQEWPSSAGPKAQRLLQLSVNPSGLSALGLEDCEGVRDLATTFSLSGPACGSAVDVTLRLDLLMPALTSPARIDRQVTLYLTGSRHPVLFEFDGEAPFIQMPIPTREIAGSRSSR